MIMISLSSFSLRPQRISYFAFRGEKTIGLNTTKPMSNSSGCTRLVDVYGKPHPTLSQTQLACLSISCWSSLATQELTVEETCTAVIWDQAPRKTLLLIKVYLYGDSAS